MDVIVKVFDGYHWETVIYSYSHAYMVRVESAKERESHNSLFS